MFGEKFQRKYALTDQGVRNTKKGTFWTVIVNLVVMGGVSILLFGIIAASGLRMLVERKVDYTRPDNLILTSVVLVTGISGAKLAIGPVILQGMGLATVVAIVISLCFTIFRKTGIGNNQLKHK